MCSGPVQVRVSRAPQARDLPLPEYATAGAAAMDLRAAVAEARTLHPGERAVIPTGIHVAIPAGYEGQVRARSGLAARKGLGMVNAPGTIDCDYRGEVVVVLINWSAEPQTISRGDRIAQLAICPVARAELVEADELDVTHRGHGGLGHTGTE